MMKCPVEAQRQCKYSYMCGKDPEVADDSECADFIMSVIVKQLEKQEDEPPEKEG